jgi:DNA-binding NarL/FixJ family response regulator
MPTYPFQPSELLLCPFDPADLASQVAAYPEIASWPTVAPANLLATCLAEKPKAVLFWPATPACLTLIESICATAPALSFMLVLPPEPEPLHYEAATFIVHILLSTSHWPQELPKAWAKHTMGRRYISPRLALLGGAFGLMPKIEDQLALLTDRELEVLALVAVGLAARQIADQLPTAESTIKSHKAACRTKLGLADRAALYFFAERHRAAILAAQLAKKRN